MNSGTSPANNSSVVEGAQTFHSSRSRVLYGAACHLVRQHADDPGATAAADHLFASTPGTDITAPQDIGAPTGTALDLPLKDPEDHRFGVRIYVHYLGWSYGIRTPDLLHAMKPALSR